MFEHKGEEIHSFYRSSERREEGAMFAHQLKFRDAIQ